MFWCCVWDGRGLEGEMKWLLILVFFVWVVGGVGDDEVEEEEDEEEEVDGYYVFKKLGKKDLKKKEKEVCWEVCFIV